MPRARKHGTKDDFLPKWPRKGVGKGSLEISYSLTVPNNSAKIVLIAGLLEGLSTVYNRVLLSN